MSMNYETGGGGSETRYRADSQAMDSNSEIEDSVVNLKPREPKKEVDKDDDEFVKAFESLLTENIAQRTKESIKMPTVDIAVPMHLSSKIKQSSATSDQPPAPVAHELKGLPYLNKSQPKEQEKQEEDEKSAAASTKKDNQKQMFNFVIMSKRNNKPQYHNMKVPISSSFANQFRAREEAEKVEKEKLKQLTLNINERIEQEELQGI